MNRRDFSKFCLASAATMAAGGLPAKAHADSSKASQPDSGTREGKPHISFLLYEGMTALDLVGPAEVLAGDQFTVDYVWRDMTPVYAETRADRRLGFMPTATFADVSRTDILCVPGTSNPYRQILEDDIIDWVSRVGGSASWVTSVCTGSFILGAAGLLKGYRATAHWTVLDELRYFGAVPTAERVVRDRNRVTGAGVSSGIDFGLFLLALLLDSDTAKTKQLLLEYDPEPPFTSGSPKTAAPELVERVGAMYAANVRKNIPYAASSLARAAGRLGIEMPGAAVSP